MAFMKTNSVDIIVDGITYNSLNDFGLAIKNTDYIGDPVLDEHFAFVPGRNGPLDFTNVFGGPTYKYRPIFIEFGGLQDAENWDAWISNFRNLFHGKAIQLIFANDSDWYYTGRCTVEEFSHIRAIGTFNLCINYASPFKYKVAETSYEVGISDQGTSQICSNTKMQVWPQFEATNNCTVTFGDITHTIPAETPTVFDDIVFGQGDNTVTLTGSGTVTITYREGSL